jgi:hypothetical protein
MRFETLESPMGKYGLYISLLGNCRGITNPNALLDLAWWLRDKVVPWLEKEALRLEKVNSRG